MAVLATMALAAPQRRTRQGVDVTCDDGRRGIFTENAIVWPDRTRSSASSYPSVIIGNKASVSVGKSVFVGERYGIWCRWTSQTRRTRRAAPSSTACPTAIEA